VNPNRIREAVVAVADRIRKNETVDLAATVAGEDLEGWLEDLALSTIAKDGRAVKRRIREGTRQGFGTMQIALPGMEHAGLPLMMWRREDDGSETAVPLPLATFAEVRREVAQHRRAVKIADRIVKGFEATIDKLETLGVTDETTGAEILEQFAPSLEIEAGDA